MVNCLLNFHSRHSITGRQTSAAALVHFSKESETAALGRRRCCLSGANGGPPCGSLPLQPNKCRHTPLHIWRRAVRNLLCIKSCIMLTRHYCPPHKHRRFLVEFRNGDIIVKLCTHRANIYLLKKECISYSLRHYWALVLKCE